MKVAPLWRGQAHRYNLVGSNCTTCLAPTLRDRELCPTHATPENQIAKEAPIPVEFALPVRSPEMALNPPGACGSKERL